MSVSKLRIGKDITIKMSVLTNGEPVSLEGRDISVMLKTPMCENVSLDFSTEGNVITAKYEGINQKYCGVYMLTVWENYGKIGQSALDFCNAFELVSSTCKEVPASEGLEIETVTLEGDLSIGLQGASAYEVALNNGFEGTEEEWLESLKGKDFAYEDFTEEQISELQRPATEAAQTASEATTKALEATSSANEAAHRAQQAATSAENATTEANEAIENVNATNTSVTEAESSRVQAERERQQAEASRQSAETERESTFATLSGEVEQAVNKANSAVIEAEGALETAQQASTLATEAAESANQAASNATTAAQTATEAAQSASQTEASIEQAEALRVTAEQQRQTKEAERESAEESRKQAESGRVTAEQGRVSAENDRVVAEQERRESFESLETQAGQVVADAQEATAEANKAIEAVNSAADAVDGRIKDIENQIDNMEAEGNALTADVAAGKALVANAITAKGVPTSPTSSFEQLASNIGQIYKGVYDDSFKIKIDNTNQSPEVERIGSADFPNWLEANIRNVMLKDGVINYYLNPENSRLKDNGLPAVVDGSEGDVMIILPRFWYSMVFLADGIEITFSKVPQTSEGWMESPEIYVGASEGVIKTTGGKDYLHSCFNTSPEYRGGSHGSANSSWDGLTKSLLGMPRTSKNHDAFRLAAQNKINLGFGTYHQYDYRAYVKILLMFMCVYGTRNIQEEYAGIDPSTGDEYRNSDGFKYGGLGRGVADCGAWWNSFNSQNPFIQTDVSYDLGVNSGVVNYVVNIGTAEEPVTQIVKVPVLWGMANPYGHIYKAMDGITKQVVEVGGYKMDRWGLFSDPKEYKSSGTDGASAVIDIPIVNSGYIKTMDEHFLPTAIGAGENSYWSDYLYASNGLNNYAVFHGGLASHGGFCGLASLNSYDGVGAAYASYGGRLCFSPS